MLPVSESSFRISRKAGTAQLDMLALRGQENDGSHGKHYQIGPCQQVHLGHCALSRWIWKAGGCCSRCIMLSLSRNVWLVLNLSKWFQSYCINLYMCTQYIHTHLYKRHMNSRFMFHVFFGELGFESFSDRFPSIVPLLMLIWADTVSTLVCCTGRGTNPVSWWITCSSGSVCQSCMYVHFIHTFRVAKTPLTLDRSLLCPQ